MANVRWRSIEGLIERPKDATPDSTATVEQNTLGQPRAIAAIMADMTASAAVKYGPSYAEGLKARYMATAPALITLAAKARRSDLLCISSLRSD